MAIKLSIFREKINKLFVSEKFRKKLGIFFEYLLNAQFHKTILIKNCEKTTNHHLLLPGTLVAAAHAPRLMRTQIRQTNLLVLALDILTTGCLCNELWKNGNNYYEKAEILCESFYIQLQFLLVCRAIACTNTRDNCNNVIGCNYLI